MKCTYCNKVGHQFEDRHKLCQQFRDDIMVNIRQIMQTEQEGERLAKEISGEKKFQLVPFNETGRPLTTEERYDAIKKSKLSEEDKPYYPTFKLTMISTENHLYRMDGFKRNIRKLR